MRPSYALRRSLRRLAIRLPQPRWLYRLCRFYCDTVDGEGFADMTINGELTLLRREAPACRVFVDGGAHHGEWAAAALECNPAASVYCFEPEPAAYAALERRALGPGATLERAALSSCDGERELDLGSSSFHPRPRDADASTTGPATVTVPTVTLDSFCEEHGIERVDFLKLDLEGHELAALEGARGLLVRGAIARVQFEYGPYGIYARTWLRDLWALLEGHGFALSKIVPRGLVPLAAYDERLENFRYQNFFARCRDTGEPDDARTSSPC